MPPRVEAEQRPPAAALGAGLWPETAPTVPGMDVASRRLSDDAEGGVGGSFCDLFRLGRNDWGLVVGDAGDRGAPAAGRAALARSALRTAAAHRFLPSAVLEEAAATLAADSSRDAGARFCTVVFARLQLDTCGAWVTLAGAGHPRPIVVRRAGWIDVRGQVGTPLGTLSPPPPSDDRVGLGPGDALVFCTDGITSARDAAGELFSDEGLPDVLLACAGAPADVLAHRVEEAVTAFAAGKAAGKAAGDAAVLVVKVPDDAAADPLARLSAATGVPLEELELPGYRVGEPPSDLWHRRPPPPREARIQLPTEPAGVGAARRFLAGLLHSWRMSELVGGDAELLVSELATNAVCHAGSPFTVIVRYDGESLRVEVGDGSRALPEARRPGSDDVSGRGMMLVEALASSWGVSPTVDGKRVWFRVPAGEPAS